MLWCTRNPRSIPHTPWTPPWGTANWRHCNVECTALTRSRPYRFVCTMFSCTNPGVSLYPHRPNTGEAGAGGAPPRERHGTVRWYGLLSLSGTQCHAATHTGTQTEARSPASLFCSVVMVTACTLLASLQLPPALLDTNPIIWFALKSCIWRLFFRVVHCEANSTLKLTQRLQRWPNIKAT